MSWVGRDKKVVWHPFTPLEGVDDPLVVLKAEGVYLHTEDGEKIIDAVSSWWVNLHGHSHPDIVAAISKQASELEHVIFAGFTHKPAIELAESILSILPENQNKIFYSDNGSTAVEVALKMAFQYWHNKGEERQKVIAIDGAYHGDTFGAMAVGERGEFTKPFVQHLFEVDFIDFPTGDNENEVIAQFKKFVSSNKVASFIYEPIIQGAAGMRIYSPSLLDRLISIAQKNGIICIADEVMTGFGRTGKMFASGYLNTNPDIICLSKGLTGGAMALGATSCTEDVLAAFKTSSLQKTFLHGHSYTANPMACAAGLASYKLLATKTCQNDIERISDKHKEFINRVEEHKIVKDARSLGTVFAIEFDSGEKTSYLSEMRNTLYPFFISRGVLLRPLGNLIYIIPPYIITNQQLDTIYEAIVEFLTTHAS